MRRFPPLLANVAVLLAVLGASGCSNILANLRPDPPDDSANQPTVGGRWVEGGFLSESPPEAGDGRFDPGMRSSGRGLASVGSDGGYGDSGGSWVDSDRDAANRRDGMRGGDDGQAVSYDDNPNMPPSTKRMYKNGSRATRADFIDESPNEGSLWASGGQTNYYFTKNKVRSVGDLITLTMEADLIRDVGNEVRRTLTDSEKQTELALAQQRASARAAGAATPAGDSVTTSQAAPDRSPAAAGSGDATAAAIQPSDIDVGKSLDVKAGDTMMAEIVERYPNGNYKIRGTKKVNYKNGAPRLLTLVGVVRSSDIGEDDVLSSGKLYEYRLEALR